MATSSIPNSVAGLVLPPFDASDLNDLLIHFVSNGQLEAIESLLGQGADVNMRNTNGETSLHYAALFCSVEIVEYLVSRGANVNAKDDFGNP